MAALLRRLFALCLFRQGPQDLPYSPWLSRGLVAALLLLQFLVARHGGFGVADALARVALSLFLVVGVTRGLLAARDRVARSEQTIAAFAGTGLLFGLAMLPVAWNLQPPVQDVPPGPAQFGLAVAGLTLFVWKLRVDAHIWRQALDLRLGALALAIALMLLELLLVTLLNPGRVA